MNFEAHWKNRGFLFSVDHEGKSLEGGDVAFENELTNQRLRKIICGWKLWFWLATTKKFTLLSVFPSNNRLSKYGYRLSKACIRLMLMSYGTNTVKGFCIRLTDIENTGEKFICRCDCRHNRWNWSYPLCTKGNEFRFHTQHSFHHLRQHQGGSRVYRIDRHVVRHRLLIRIRANWFIDRNMLHYQLSGQQSVTGL